MHIRTPISPLGMVQVTLFHGTVNTMAASPSITIRDDSHELIMFLLSLSAVPYGLCRFTCLQALVAFVLAPRTLGFVFLLLCAACTSNVDCLRTLVPCSYDGATVFISRAFTVIKRNAFTLAIWWRTEFYYLYVISGKYLTLITESL